MFPLKLTEIEASLLVGLVSEEIEVLQWQIDEETDFLQEAGMLEDMVEEKVMYQELLYKLTQSQKF